MTTFKAGDGKLNELEAAWVGQPAGIPLKELPADTLRLLATRYFDEWLTRSFNRKYYGQTYAGNWREFFARRVATLSRLMGETFDTIKAEKTAEWIRLCAKAEADERALSPCPTCGRSRRLADERYHKDDGLCGNCMWEWWGHEHPSCADGDQDDPIGEDDVF